MKNGHILVKVDIPLYVVKVINERHILVAGGGGSANTGVRNAVEIYQLSPCFGSDSLKSPCDVKVLKRYYTENRAIMSGTVFRDEGHFILAGGGINGECVLYQMRPTIQRESTHANGSIPGAGDTHRDSFNALNNLRRRRTSSSGSADSVRDSYLTRNMHLNSESGLFSRRNSLEEVPETNAKVNHSNSKDSHANGDISIGYELNKLTSFRTDFNKSNSEEEPFLKVIRYNPASSVMVTGGADGHIRIWRYPDITRLVDITAHKDEIDDLDIDQVGEVISSVSRDGHAFIWNASNGKKLCELDCQLPVIKTFPKPVKYLIRACRFGPSQNLAHKLYTIHNPAIREKPPRHAYIFKWDAKAFTREKIVSLGPLLVSSMAITDDGKFIGIGTQDGTVDIYNALNLKKMYSAPKAHNIFVTGLEFLKTCPESQRLIGNSECSLISISVDRRIVLHDIPKQKPIGLFTFTILYLLMIFPLFFLLDYYYTS